MENKTNIIYKISFKSKIEQFTYKKKYSSYISFTFFYLIIIIYLFSNIKKSFEIILFIFSPLIIINLILFFMSNLNNFKIICYKDYLEVFNKDYFSGHGGLEENNISPYYYKLKYSDLKELKYLKNKQLKINFIDNYNPLNENKTILFEKISQKNYFEFSEIVNSKKKT